MGDRQDQRRARAQLAAVEIPAVAPLELGVYLAVGRNDGEAADQRPRREARPLVEAQDPVLHRVELARALVGALLLAEVISGFCREVAGPATEYPMEGHR